MATTLATIALAPLIAFFALLILWDMKLRPRQLALGRNPLKGSDIAKFSLQAAVTDKPDRDAQSLAGKIDYRIVYIILYVAYLAVTFAWWEDYIIMEWYVPVAVATVVFGVIAGRIRQVINTRMAKINSLFEVVNPKMRYLTVDKNAALHPWDYVNVTEVTKSGEPKKVVIKIPPTFSVSADSERSKFENEFSALTLEPTEAEWKYEWVPKNLTVTAERIPPLPTSVDYPGSADKPWNMIPLGVSQKGEECWDLKDNPQGMIVGLTGSGKSVLQRSIIYHVFQHADEIELYGVDMKKIELTMWENYPGVAKIATTIEEAAEVISLAEAEMTRRFTMIEDFNRSGRGQVNHIDKLPGKHKAIIVMLDESAQALMLSGGKSPEEKEEDALRGQLSFKLKQIARLGRAAKVHLVVCTQRAEVAAIGGGDAKNNYGFRVLLGRGDKTASMMALDNTDGTFTTPGIKGRGVMARDGATTRFHAYWTPENWPIEKGYGPGSTNTRTPTPDNTPNAGIASEEDFLNAIHSQPELPTTAAQAGVDPISSPYDLEPFDYGVSGDDDGFEEYGVFDDDVTVDGVKIT